MSDETETQEEIFEFDEDDLPPADPDLPRRLSKICLKLLEYEQELAKIEERKSKLQRNIRFYAERLIPQVMDDMGSRVYETALGVHVELKDDVYMSFPKEPDRRERAFAWLRENGEAGLIRQDLTASFGPGTDDVAERLWAEFEKVSAAADITREETVNHQSTLALLRKRLKNPDLREKTPLEIFGAGEKSYAKITLKKR